ncbi:predicted protein, partial [Nematostella vectensis]
MKRLPMRKWLMQKLDNAAYPGLNWIDRRRGLFRVGWKHGSRQTYKEERDACVFRAWAEYTGRYRPGDVRNPRRWKTNFRCAMNALPDIEEVPEKSRKQGNGARKVYMM